jgi:hypothetical protein
MQQHLIAYGEFRIADIVSQNFAPFAGFFNARIIANRQQIPTFVGVTPGV